MLALPITVERRAGVPMYRQIEQAMRDAILDGRLRPGARVPSVRAMAGQLGVARITVVTAYEQLSAEGYLVGRAGSGTTVAPELPERWMQVRAESIRRRRHAGRRVARLPEAMPYAFSEGFFERWAPVAGRDAAFDFTTGSTSLDLFPTDLWERMLRDAWRQLSAEGATEGTSYRFPAGDPLLREVLAEYLGASRAVRCSADDIVITAGAQGAMKAAVRLWLDPSRSYVVEDPGGPHLWRTFQTSGARMVPVPVDRSGLRVDRLPAEATTALVTPSWQYPSGGTLSLQRRMALLAWASEAGAVIIEDDCDSELRYSGHPLPSLQGLDEDGRVLYAGTFSKVMFPGLRTGYAVVPPHVRSLFGAMVEATDRGPGAVEQRAIALFLAGGHFERHLRRLRTAFAERQRAMVGALRRHLVGILEVDEIPAGTHVVARVVDPAWDASTLARAGAAAGVLVEPMSLSRVAPAADDRLLVHYARHAPDRIRQGVAQLAHAIRYGPSRNERPA